MPDALKLIQRTIDNNATLENFKASIPSVLQSILLGTTIAAGCGGYDITRNPDGSVTLSPAAARWVMERLNQ